MQSAVLVLMVDEPVGPQGPQIVADHADAAAKRLSPLTASQDGPPPASRWRRNFPEVPPAYCGISRESESVVVRWSFR